MPQQPIAVFVFFTFAWLPAALGQTHYKCQNSAGKVEFSDAPCSADLSQGRVRARANSLDSSGNRELMLRQENERLKEQLREQEKKTTASGAPQRTQSDLQAERIDQFACEKAKRDYEVTASSKFNSVEIIEAKRSMMYGTCGMREPNRTSTTVNTRIIVH